MKAHVIVAGLQQHEGILHQAGKEGFEFQASFENPNVIEINVDEVLIDVNGQVRLVEGGKTMALRSKRYVGLRVFS